MFHGFYAVFSVENVGVFPGILSKTGSRQRVSLPFILLFATQTT